MRIAVADDNHPAIRLRHNRHPDAAAGHACIPMCGARKPRKCAARREAGMVGEVGMGSGWCKLSSSEQHNGEKPFQRPQSRPWTRLHKVGGLLQPPLCRPCRFRHPYCSYGSCTTKPPPLTARGRALCDGRLSPDVSTLLPSARMGSQVWRPGAGVGRDLVWWQAPVRARGRSEM